MKTKIKNRLVLILAFLVIPLVLWNCKNDVQPIQDVQINKYNSKILSLEDLRSNENLMDIVAKFPKKIKENNIASREVYDSINDFYIDTDKIIYTEENGISKYSFNVYRASYQSGIETVLLTLNEDGTYTSLLVHYDINPDFSLDGETQTTASVHEIDFDTDIFSNATSRMACVCTWDIVLTPIDGPYDDCDCIYYVSSIENLSCTGCGDSGGGGSSGTGGGGTSSGSGSTGGGFGGSAGGGGSSSGGGLFINAGNMAATMYVNNLPDEDKECLNQNAIFKWQLEGYLSEQYNASGSTYTNQTPSYQAATQFADQAIEAVCSGELTSSFPNSNMLEFSSFDEFNNFKDSLTDISASSQSVEYLSSPNTQITKFIFDFGASTGVLTPLHLTFRPKYIIDNISTISTDEFELLEVTSQLGGFTPLIEWEQNAYTHSITANVVSVQVEGSMLIGVSIGGLPFNYSLDYLAVLTFNKQTGEAISSTLVEM